ncbi:MAG: EamA family transporter [Thermoprotei archaeon]
MDRYALLLLVTCNLLWATNNIVGRLLSGYMDPFSITVFRWTLAAIFYPLVFGPSIVFKSFKYAGLKSMVLGLVGFTGFNFVFYWALSMTSASLVGFAYGITPVIIMALSFVVESLRPSRLQFTGSLLSVLGAFLLFYWRGLRLGSFNDTLGLIGGVTTGFLWALYTVLQNKFYPNSDRASLTYSSLILSIPFTLLFSYPWLSNLNLISMKLGVILALFWIAIAPGVLGYYMWNKATSIIGSNATAPYSNLLPLFVALLGYTLLREPLTLGDVIGGILIVTGSTIAVIK